MRVIQSIFSVIFVAGLISCSADSASVSGSPPLTPDVFFKAGALQGTFQTSKSPTVFMWPLEVDGKILTRDERIEKRSEIIYQSEVLAVIDDKLKEPAKAITNLTTQFQQSQCGLFEADDFFGDADPNATEVTEWKDPNNDEEAKAIAACQQNQGTREKIKTDGIIPLCQAKGGTLGQLLGAVGEQNYLATFQQLTIEFEGNGSSGEPRIEILGFQGKTFSSESENPFYAVRKILLNTQAGLLSFSVPYLQESGDDGELILIGEYIFNLEISGSDSKISMGGEIQRIDQFRGVTELGRASFSGGIGVTELEADPCQ